MSTLTRRLRAVGTAALVTFGVAVGTGCDTIDPTAPPTDRSGLVADLATRLERGGELTYAARYQLPGGGQASIVQAQEPFRVAFTYPGGLITITPAGTTACTTTGGATTCRRTPPAAPVNRLAADLFLEAGRHGLVLPVVVVGLLSAAGLDPDAIIEQHDTTVAGLHSSCVKVNQLEGAPAGPFTVCITTDGVLGSFTGVVNGTPVDLTLTRYQERIPPAAFELPAGARLVTGSTGPD